MVLFVIGDLFVILAVAACVFPSSDLVAHDIGIGRGIDLESGAASGVASDNIHSQNFAHLRKTSPS